MLRDLREPDGFIHYSVYFKDSIPTLEKIAAEFDLKSVDEVIQFLISCYSYEVSRFGHGRGWQFNQCRCPKFWFGDRVFVGTRTGTIFGLLWQTEEIAISDATQSGWWYQILLSGNTALQKVHEDSLTTDG